MLEFVDLTHIYAYIIAIKTFANVMVYFLPTKYQSRTLFSIRNHINPQERMSPEIEKEANYKQLPLPRMHIQEIISSLDINTK